MTLVSVCIPCHNAAPYLEAALDSLLAQNWPNLEIIVVNDGSTDGSGVILNGYKARGVRVIYEIYGSAAKARNRALAEATGDLIKFFDADDLLSSNHIRLQVECLGGRIDAVAFSEWGRFYKDDISTFKSNPQSVWQDMEASDWLVESWADARPMMQPGMFLIPREIIDAAGGWDEDLTLIDDFEFFSRIISSSQEVLFTPDATLYYRSGLDVSLSGRKSRQAVESAFDSAFKATNHLLNRRTDDEAKRSCANVLQSLVYTYYPEHADLLKVVEGRISELGGSRLLPEGPPRFQRLRGILGWRIARRIQRWAGK